MATTTETYIPEPEADTAVEAPSSPQEPRSLATLPDVPPRRPIAAILADLRRPLPPECVAEIPATTGKNGKMRPAQKFLHWWNVATVLDTYAPGWSGTVMRVDKIGEKCSVTYRITIPAAEGDCVMEDAGMEDEDKDDYGDAMTGAIATAFKRTAAKFGVGRDLYALKDPTAKALETYLRQQTQASLTDIQRLILERDVDKTAVNTWLQQQIPQHALRRLQARLEATTKV